MNVLTSPSHYLQPPPASPDDRAFDTIGDAVVKLAARLADADLDFLAIAAAAPRMAVPIITEHGIDGRHFLDDDLRAIFAAILHVGNPTGNPRWSYDFPLVARAALKNTGCWDETETRKFIGPGVEWGPSSLAAFLCAAEFDADDLGLLAVELIDLERQLAALGAGVSA